MTTRANALRQLERFVGRWRTTGVLFDGPDAGRRFSGSDVYRWLPGDSFLQHTWNVRMPDGHHRGLELFGFDPETAGIFAHAYDADGTFTASRIAFRGRAFTITGDALSFAGRFSADGDAMSGQWSTTEGAHPVMQVDFVRRSR